MASAPGFYTRGSANASRTGCLLAVLCWRASCYGRFSLSGRSRPRTARRSTEYFQAYRSAVLTAAGHRYLRRGHFTRRGSVVESGSPGLSHPRHFSTTSLPRSTTNCSAQRPTGDGRIGYLDRFTCCCSGSCDGSSSIPWSRNGTAGSSARSALEGASPPFVAGSRSRRLLA